jgi:hypothetical protein
MIGPAPQSSCKVSCTDVKCLQKFIVEEDLSATLVHRCVDVRRRYRGINGRFGAERRAFGPRYCFWWKFDALALYYYIFLSTGHPFTCFSSATGFISSALSPSVL